MTLRLAHSCRRNLKRSGGLLVMVLSVLATGCAESVVINSKPPGALVEINGAAIGTTPVQFSTRGVGHPFKYRVTLEGYEPVEGMLRSRVSAGRIVACTLTFCITRIFLPFRYFADNPLEITLEPPGHTGDLEARLARLKELLDRGMITREEYELLRRRALQDYVTDQPPDPKTGAH